MGWQTPIAIAIALGAGAYALWRMARPFFDRDTAADQTHNDLLQIDSPED